MILGTVTTGAVEVTVTDGRFVDAKIVVVQRSGQVSEP